MTDERVDIKMKRTFGELERKGPWTNGEVMGEQDRDYMFHIVEDLNNIEMSLRSLRTIANIMMFWSIVPVILFLVTLIVGYMLLTPL